MELNTIVFILTSLFIVLTFLQIVISHLIKDPRIKLIYKHRRKSINYHKVLKFTLIIFVVLLSSPISHGTFEWYYIFLPLSIVGFLLVHKIYHISFEGRGSEYTHITDEDIIIHKRNETIDKILK